MLDNFIQLYKNGGVNNSLAKELFSCIEIDESNIYQFCDFYISLSTIESVDLNCYISKHQPELFIKIKNCIDNYEYHPSLLDLLRDNNDIKNTSSFIQALKKVKDLPISELKATYYRVKSEIKNGLV